MKKSIVYLGVSFSLMTLLGGSLEEGFSHPPDAAKPRVWWHWMNGNVSKAGITADLEAMAKAGIGGAHLFDVGCAIPPGSVKFNTPAWDEHVAWAAQEAKRLGLELTLVNCSGFANAGGPWVAASNAMFFVTCSETRVAGGSRIAKPLPRLAQDHGFYKDIACLAFPLPAAEREDVPLKVESPATNCFVVSAAKPVTLRGFSFRMHNTVWCWDQWIAFTVETSDDGKAWAVADRVEALNYSMGKCDCVDQTKRVSFNHRVTGRFVRITSKTKRAQASGGPSEQNALAEIVPERGYALPNINERTLRATGPMSPVGYEADASEAVDVAQVVDLTAKLRADGTLDWTAPAGVWVVLRVGYYANGVGNHPASQFGGGFEVDKLDASAVRRHLEAYVGKFAAKYPAIKATLCDSYEVGPQNWTHGLEKTFEKTYGYSFVPYLVAFTGRAVGSAAKTEAVLYDFRRLVSDLFSRNFAGEMTRVCKQYGIRAAIEPYGNMPADATTYGANCDLPMAEFWVREGDEVTDQQLAHAFGAKAVASAAHLHDRSPVDAEAFTAQPDRSGRWLKDPFGLKAMGDAYYCAGVSRMVYHRFAHQPWTSPARLPGMTMGQWGTHFERTETWWPMVGPWIAYQQRCQFLLNAGVPANDVLVYVGDEVPNDAKPEDVPGRHSWDVCGKDDLQQLSVVDGALVPREAPAVRYAALVVPTNRFVTAASRERIAQLKAAGARVCKTGEALGFEPDFLYSGTTAHVRAIGRRYDEHSRGWFVAYPSTNAATVVCSFRVASDGAPQLWDAESGRRVTARTWRRVGDRTEVTVRFKPCGSIFVMFGRTDQVPMEEGERSIAKAVPLTGPWTLRFPAGWNCPASVTLKNLVSWTKIPEGEARFFSGIAEYECNAPIAAQSGQRVMLDLGTVKNLAEVTVNGKTFPPLWRPPFQLDITDALAAAPKTVSLKIRVANLWPNRLIGDEFKPDDREYGFEWATQAVKTIPDWVREGKPSPTGRLTFTTWHHWTRDDALIPSGLLGPVSLRYVR